MGTLISQLVIDAADPLALARWWGQVLDWPVGQDDTEPYEAWIEPPGTPAPGLGGILFQRVPESKAGKNRLHLDVRPTDGSSQAAELDRLLALGATRVDVGQGDVPWHVLADPEGNELCLLRSTPGELAELLATRDATEGTLAGPDAAASPA